MKAYASTSANVTGAFPLTVGKNSSTGTSTDGTPYVADYLNDLWPVLQGLMDRCGMTPSGSVEAYVAVGSGSNIGQGAFTGVATAQHLQSLAYNFGAPGEIVMDFIQGVNALPATRRALALQGQMVDGYLYPDLWYNCWCGSAANATASSFYTTSDAGGTTRATTGMTVNGVTGGRYLRLPDVRGLSPVGYGSNGTFTAVNATAFSSSVGLYAGQVAGLGAVLTDLMQGHYHDIASNAGASIIQNGGTGSSASIATSGSAFLTGKIGAPITDGTNGVPRTGAWTRGPSFACNIGIRY